MYCWRIGYFPQDISVGDGMLFILLAIASGGLYLFFIMSLTSLGYGVKYIGLVIKYGWDWLQEYRRVAAGQAASTTPLSLPPFRFDLWIFAAFGVLFITLLSHSDLLTAILLTVCAPCCLWLWGKSQKNAKAIVELDQKRNKTQEELKRLKNMRTMQPLGFVIFLAAPLLVGGVTGQFLDGVMRLVNVRNDTAVVHIKAPYIQYAKEYGIKGQASAFGSDYARFDKSAILFNGFGKNVVVEMTNSDGPVSLVIPSESIFIIQKSHADTPAR
jgi:hypothetical protein